MLKKLSIVLCASALLAGSAFATTTPTAYTVTFNGKVTKQSCTFSVNGVQGDSAVNLGNVRDVADELGSWHDLPVALVNCGNGFAGANVLISHGGVASPSVNRLTVDNTGNGGGKADIAFYKDKNDSPTAFTLSEGLRFNSVSGGGDPLGQTIFVRLENGIEPGDISDALIFSVVYE